MLALGPGSLVRHDGGALRGRVVSAGFRRGVVELEVDVEGVGQVTVVEPSGVVVSSGGPRGGGMSSADGVSARGLPEPGDVVRLAARSGAIAIVHDSGPDGGRARGQSAR